MAVAPFLHQNALERYLTVGSDSIVVQLNTGCSQNIPEALIHIVSDLEKKRSQVSSGYDTNIANQH
jgi:hypothetical protein